MAGKDNITPIPIIANGDMSQAFLFSPSIRIQGFNNVAVALVYSGAPYGTFNFSVSQDQINWIVLPAALFQPEGPILAIGSPDQVGVQLSQMTWAYFQLSYINTSGTGTLNATLTAKLI